MATTPRNGYTDVAAPERTPVKGGLFDAADVTPLVGHQAMGIRYELEATGNVHQIVESTSDEMGTAAKDGYAKGIDFEEGIPFTVVASMALNRFQMPDSELLGRLSRRLEAGKQRAVEQIVWEQLLPGYAGAGDLNAAGAVSVKDAIGILEEYAGKSYDFTPTLHFGKRIAPYLAGDFLVKFDATEAAPIGGSQAANGSGYFATAAGPAKAESGAGARWIWLTGQVAIHEGAAVANTAFDPMSNTILGIAEQTFIVTFDGLAAAVRANLS